jgi:hypothetical protein
MSTSPITIPQTTGTNGTQVSYPLIINPNVLNYNSYIANQRAFYERTIGGTGWTEDQIANNAVRSRNLAPQSGRVNFNNGSFNFSSTAGTFYNSFNENNANASVPITLALPNQIVRLSIETGGIWLQSVGSNVTIMTFKLERSASPTFASVTVINNSANASEFVGRSNSGISSYNFSFEDDDIKPAGTYYYRLMVNFGLTVIVNHWNWQGWVLYDVINSRSSF